MTSGQNSNVKLHKRIGNGHGGDDHNVHEQREDNYTLVELDESVVLGKAVLDQVRLDSLQEVPVEESIHDEVEAFLDTIPVLIDEVIPRFVSLLDV